MLRFSVNFTFLRYDSAQAALEAQSFKLTEHDAIPKTATHLDLTGVAAFGMTQRVFMANHSKKAKNA